MRVAIAVLGLLSTLGFAQARSCGYEPEPLKREGEPCTRTDECQSGLECRGGVCMVEIVDAGTDPDAGSDAGSADAGGNSDAGATSDAAIDAAGIDSGL